MRATCWGVPTSPGPDHGLNPPEPLICPQLSLTGGDREPRVGTELSWGRRLPSPWGLVSQNQGGQTQDGLVQRAQVQTWKPDLHCVGSLGVEPWGWDRRPRRGSLEEARSLCYVSTWPEGSPLPPSPGSSPVAQRLPPSSQAPCTWSHEEAACVVSAAELWGLRQHPPAEPRPGPTLGNGVRQQPRFVVGGANLGGDWLPATGNEHPPQPRFRTWKRAHARQRGGDSVAPSPARGSQGALPPGTWSPPVLHAPPHLVRHAGPPGLISEWAGPFGATSPQGTCQHSSKGARRTPGFRGLGWGLDPAPGRRRLSQQRPVWFAATVSCRTCHESRAAQVPSASSSVATAWQDTVSRQPAGEAAMPHFQGGCWGHLHPFKTLGR